MANRETFGTYLDYSVSEDIEIQKLHYIKVPLITFLI